MDKGRIETDLYTKTTYKHIYIYVQGKSNHVSSAKQHCQMDLLCVTIKSGRNTGIRIILDRKRNQDTIA